MDGAESLAEQKHSARLGKTFRARWLAVLVGGWLRKAENKAKAQQSWGLGFAELGNIGSLVYNKPCKYKVAGI